MKQIYFFNEGNRDMRTLLGGKGANLAEMTQLGLPVPSGFTITTEVCHAFQANHGELPAGLMTELKASLIELEKRADKKFNDPENPLLVSVRSGAPISMPGMMDTILNLGLNDQTVEGLAKLTNNERFAWDCYRRLIQMFGNVVFQIPEQRFEKELSAVKADRNATSDLDLTTDDLKEIVKRYHNVYLEEIDRPFPQSATEQLTEAISAVFTSWNNDRAIVYRELHHISETLGTAVNVQMMAFGNSGDDSGTGVAFSRSPVTGENRLFGEFLKNAQGEDVVSGVRTPKPIQELADEEPEIYEQFRAITEQLEQHYHDMQDVEFTIEHGKLFLLQTRDGKRTPKAAVKVAVDQVKEGLINKEQALLRIDPEQISQLLHPEFTAEQLKSKEVLATGLPASPGAASGEIQITAAAAKAANDAGHKVVLVRQDTSPEDISGMIASSAIVTSRGGMTSHAAVVARGMGTCGVVGCAALNVSEEDQCVYVGDQKLPVGTVISVDGTTGNLYVGEIEADSAAHDENLQQILDWAKEAGEVAVYANADTPADFEQALRFEAAGIGLTRTEHMFFAPERLIEMRRLIVAKTAEDRKPALAALKEMQTEDFKALYRLAEGKTVTVRLLDPPLHEFLPHDEKELNETAADLQVPVEDLRKRVVALKEVNPMLGLRGSRLAVTMPDVYAMQVDAIISAAFALQDEHILVKPHIMLPLIASKIEMEVLRKRISDQIDAACEEVGRELHYQVGTMIELPRACIEATGIAENADFFSFGTNDLTQLTFGYSRDDIGQFLPAYLEKGLLPADPFNTLDQTGVGELMEMAVTRGREEKHSLPIGVCGEVGGDPSSMKFFDRIGIDYVSCSPFRVPVALLASAQAALQHQYRYREQKEQK
jgi:pyruvate,orthophosphate dikinase